MKTRIIVELDNAGDKHQISLRGECEGENEGDSKDNIGLMVDTAILKRRIANVLDVFRPEEITLAEIAKVNNCRKAVKQ